MVYEEYRDQAAYEAHTSTEHFRRYAVEEGIPLLESRERAFYEPVG
jgi:quinol monooxygenase YgiN